MFCRVQSNFGEANVTKKRVKCQKINLFMLRRSRIWKNAPKMTNDKNDILTPIKKKKLGNLHRLPNSAKKKIVKTI